MGKQKTTTADIDHSVMCCNRDCFKSHCARNWRNHNNTDAVNLNPYGEFKCPGYLPKFRVKTTNLGKEEKVWRP